jgi:hypothetical protein
MCLEKHSRMFLRYAQPQRSTPYPLVTLWGLRQSLSFSFDQDFGLRNSSPTKKDRGFNTPVLLLPRRSPLVWVGVWSQAASYSRARLLRAALLGTGFAVDELIPCVTDA